MGGRFASEYGGICKRQHPRLYCTAELTQARWVQARLQRCLQAFLNEPLPNPFNGTNPYPQGVANLLIGASTTSIIGIGQQQNTSMRQQPRRRLTRRDPFL